MMYANKPGATQAMDRKKMLKAIHEVSFAVVEMTLYLDTHPYETEAIRYFNHYNKLKNKLEKEYSQNYGPLTIANVDGDNDDRKWKWALEELPWRGGCA